MDSTEISNDFDTGRQWNAAPLVEYASPLSHSDDFSLTDSSSPLRDDLSVDAVLPPIIAPETQMPLDFSLDNLPAPEELPPLPLSMAFMDAPAESPLSPHAVTKGTTPISQTKPSVYSSYSASQPTTFTMSSSNSLTSFHISTSSSFSAGTVPTSYTATSAYSTGAGARQPISRAASGYTKAPAPSSQSVPSLAEKPKQKRARTPGRKSDYCKSEQTEEERRESKRQMRLYRNRLSAQQSRERKKQHVQLLEAKLQTVAESNKQLQLKITELTEENESLKRKLATLDYTSDSSTSPLALPSEEPPSPTAKREPLSPMLRTGATLFAFALVFTVCFSFSGVEFLKLSTPGRTVAPVEPPFSHGRALKWESANEPLVTPALPASPPALPSLAPQALLPSTDTVHHAVVKLSAQVPADLQNNMLAVDIYKSNQADFVREALEMYKKMLLQSNQSLATATSSIMFCPSAVHIQPQMFTENKVLVSRDLASNGVSDAEEEARETLDPRNLLVWVPTKSLALDWAAPFLNQSAKREFRSRGSDVTELQVKVSAVRPILEGEN